MHRATRSKRKGYSPDARPLPARSQQVKSFEQRPIAGLSKRELVALVLKLQAPGAAAQGAVPDAVAVPNPAPVEIAETVLPVPLAPRASSLVIETSVRSGQTVEFPDGDVIVIGSVGSGAEIVAGGSIHVYGTLRGRAIAGTSGDQTSRIFCRSFQAELLSIDGMYRLSENLEPKLRGRPVQARLDGSNMAVTPLE